MIEGQKQMEQAVEWIENQKEHIRNYRKRCAQYKGILQMDIKEREKQKHETNQRLNEIEEKELQTNTKQMEEVIKKEQKNVTDRRVDRQNADYLSKYNIQQRRQRNVLNRISINFFCHSFSSTFCHFCPFSYLIFGRDIFHFFNSRNFFCVVFRGLIEFLHRTKAYKQILGAEKIRRFQSQNAGKVEEETSMES